MKKYFYILLSMSGLLLTHCGGADFGPGNAFAQDGGDLAGNVKSAAITGAGNDVAVDAGFASDGTTIDIPAGFVAAQCKFTAAVSDIDGSALSAHVTISSSGDVTCTKVVAGATSNSPAESTGCAASYTMICVK